MKLNRPLCLFLPGNVIQRKFVIARSAQNEVKGGRGKFGHFVIVRRFGFYSLFPPDGDGVHSLIPYKGASTALLDAAIFPPCESRTTTRTV